MASGTLHSSNVYRLDITLDEEECRILTAWLQNPIGGVSVREEQKVEQELRQELWNILNPGRPSNS